MNLPLVAALAMLLSAPALAQEDLTAATPADIQAVFQAGDRAYRAGDHTAAITLYSQVLDRDPDHKNAYLHRGFCHGIVKDHAAAVADFTAVLEREPGHKWAYISRGGAYTRMGQPALALKDLDAALAIDPKDQEAYNNRGWAHKALGDMDAACNDWRTSQRLGNGEAKILLSNNRCK
jgi:tetratricopeptide (TPR) repeat protein